MSDYGDMDFGHYEAGQEHQEIEQLHQASGSEVDYDNQFNVYEADHQSAEATSFDQGSHVEYSDGNGAHFSSTDYVSYDHAATESDHIFAAEGSESYSASEYSELDALRAQLDTAFVSATEISGVSA